jgi:hypothetical protein
VPLPQPVLGHSTVLRPYLTVTLRNGEKEFSTLALVDTGADFNMLPREVAEVLGVDVERLSGPALPFSGATAGGKAKPCTLKVEVVGRGESLGFENPFLIILNPAEGKARDVLIGRHPLFHDFDFGFRMGFTDDPEIGKFTMNKVTKRRDASRFVRHDPLIRP